MRLLSYLIATICILPTTYVYSHTFMLSPKPRSAATRTSWDAGQVIKYPYEQNGQFSPFSKIGWCGNYATPGAVPLTATLDTGILPPGMKLSSKTIIPSSQNMFKAGDIFPVYWTHPLPHADANAGNVNITKFEYGVRVTLNYTSTDMVVLNIPNAQPKSNDAIYQGHIDQAFGYDPIAYNDGQTQNWLPNATFQIPAGRTCTSCVLQFWIDVKQDGGGYVDCADISISTGQGTSKPTQGNPATGGGSTGVTTSPGSTTSPTTPTIDGLPTYSAATVLLHNTPPLDCWTSLRGVVYDISPLINRHPGGNIITSFCGFSSDSNFDTSHSNPTVAISKLITYKKGNLGDQDLDSNGNPISSTTSSPTGNPGTQGGNGKNGVEQVQSSVVVMVATLLAAILI